MITPKKVFLSFMLMIALLPLPVLNSTVAFTLTWAVLGIRKAFLVLAVSMSYGVFLTAGFVSQMWASLMGQASVATQAIQSCGTVICRNEAASSFVASVSPLLRADEVGLLVVGAMACLTLAQVYVQIRKIRAYSSSIRRFYWG